MMAMAKGEGAGSRSLPTSQGILGGNRKLPPAQDFAGSFHRGVCSEGGKGAPSPT